jgi:hypothetical protein
MPLDISVHFTHHSHRSLHKVGWDMLPHLTQDTNQATTEMVGDLGEGRSCGRSDDDHDPLPVQLIDFFGHTTAYAHTEEDVSR